MKKTIKLSGNFSKSIAVSEAMSELEAANETLRGFIDAGDYGSPEYFEALAAKKLAAARHETALKSLR